MSFDIKKINSSAWDLITLIERSDRSLGEISLECALFDQLKKIITHNEDLIDDHIKRRFQVLRCSYDFDLYLNAKEPFVCKRKADFSNEGKKQKTDDPVEDPLFSEPVISYKKDEYRTAYMVPTVKMYFGEGTNGMVFKLDKEKLAQFNPHSPLLGIPCQLLVKKTDEDSFDEFQVGHQLEHKNLVKSYYLFKKTFQENGEEKSRYKIVMEKIKGCSLEDSERLDSDSIKRYIQSTRECCLYLFDQGYYWCDCGMRNILIEAKTGELKFIDYGDWVKLEDEPLELAETLLEVGYDIVNSLISKSQLKKKRNAILSRSDMAEGISRFGYENPTNEQLKSALSLAFDAVLDTFEEALRHPDQFKDN